MPKADPFTVFGVGNGTGNCSGYFPYNFGASDPSSSGNEMFTTLAGVNSNNPSATQDQIDESFALACNLLYNTYQVVGSARSFSSRDSDTQWETTSNNLVYKKYFQSTNDYSDNPSRPIDRVCSTAGNIYTTDDSRNRVQGNIFNGIGRLTHNGELDGDLLGYTISAPWFSPFVGFFGNRGAGASTSLSLHTTDFDLQNNTDEDEIKNGFCQVNGSDGSVMHFIAKGFSEDNGDSTVTQILDPANLIFESKSDFTNFRNERIIQESKVQINSIEFYTY